LGDDTTDNSPEAAQAAMDALNAPASTDYSSTYDFTPVDTSGNAVAVDTSSGDNTIQSTDMTSTDSLDAENTDEALSSEETATVAAGGPSYSSVASGVTAASASGGSSGVTDFLTKMLPVGQKAAVAYLDKLVRTNVGGAQVQAALAPLLAKAKATNAHPVAIMSGASPLLIGGAVVAALLLVLYGRSKS